MPTFRGSLFHRGPRFFPIVPWYSWPLGFPVASLTIDTDQLRIDGPWPFVLWRWHGPYSDIMRVDRTITGVQFWMRGQEPVTFRTSDRDEILRWLRSHGVQVGPANSVT